MSPPLNRTIPQQQYEQLVATIDGIVWEADARTFRFTFVSRQAERLVGYPLEEWFKQDFWVRLIHPDDRDWATEYCLRATREKRSHDFEYRAVAADGRVVWLRDIVTVVPEGAEVTRLRGIMVDVTDRRLAEEALRRREADLKLALDAGRMGEWSWDIVTGEVTWSALCKALYGLPADAEVSYERFLATVHPDDRERVASALTRSVETRADYEVEKRIVWPDGSVRWNASRGRVFCDASGRPVRMAGLTTDITQRKQAEEERQKHLWFLESMDRVNRAIQGANDLPQLMGDVLDAVLSILACDRAWLLYPCDPTAGSWSVPMERTRPEYPGALAQRRDVPAETPEAAEVLRAVLASPGPVRFGPGAEHPLPPEAARAFRIQSQIAMALYPKVDRPYLFGLHQCSYPRVWTPEEERLVLEVGRRLADALTSLLLLRDLRESERKLEEAQRIAHVGYWDRDLGSDRINWSDETYRIFGLEPQSRPMTVDETRKLVHPDDWPVVVAAVREALKGGARYNVEYRVVRPGGETRVVHSQGDVTRDEAGEPRRMFGTVQDITERRRVEDRLRASEARFRTFVDHATDAFFLHDEAGVVLDVNRQACESLGYSREELIGMCPGDIDAQFDVEALAQVAARLAAGEVLALDTLHRRKDGSVFPVEIRIRSFWQGGRRLGISLARDITDRKRAEEELFSSRQMLQLVLDTVPQRVFWKDQNSVYAGCNTAFAQDCGFASPREVIGKTHFETDSAELAVGYRADDQEVIESGRPKLDYEEQKILPDGRLRWLKTSKVPLRDRDGKVIGVLGTYEDITDRKRADQALAESHSLLQGVVEGTSDAVYVKDTDGRYLMLNTAWARLFGMRVEEVVGKDDRDLFPPEVAAMIMQRDRQAMTSAEPLMFEETVTAAGVTRTYLSTKGVYHGAQGRVIGMIGISRDITELKRLEEQLRQAQKMEAVGRLAGGVAHDFNNLLTGILGYSDMVFCGLRPDDPSRELLTEILKLGERATNLTRQLLAFSRKQVLQPQVVSLNAVLIELRMLLGRLIGEDIELVLKPGPALGLAKVDPGQFEQAIINLAVNARDAMPQGGRLVIETRDADLDEGHAASLPEVRPGRYVLVSVSDTGCGMDEATRARIFEPFFTTKGPGKGTGLGLAMVYGFVKQTGGHVEVASEPGRGTTFNVYLPRAEETTPTAKSAQGLLKAPQGTETVLLVEDENAVRNLARLTLQSNGYTVLEARDGHEAVWVAQQHPGPIHILVTDLVMPRMSGRQLADLLARARPQTRILFMSGHTDETVLRHGVVESSVAFFQKPFRPTDLAQKVREVLDAGEGRP
jgi:PAS domain S-box-containing protein